MIEDQEAQAVIVKEHEAGMRMLWAMLCWMTGA